MLRLRRRHIDGRPAQVSVCIDFGSVTVDMARNVAMASRCLPAALLPMLGVSPGVVLGSFCFPHLIAFCYHTMNSNEVTVDSSLFHLM
jgi:hypothetical protein